MTHCFCSRGIGIAGVGILFGSSERDLVMLLRPLGVRVTRPTLRSLVRDGMGRFDETVWDGGEVTSCALAVKRSASVAPDVDLGNVHYIHL